MLIFFICIEAYVNSGLTKYYMKQYDEALKDLSKVIELDTFNYYAYNNRGIVKYELKDYQGAIEDFNKSIELNPFYAHPYFNRGDVKYMN